MIAVLPQQNFSSARDFVQALNKARLANKKKWITYVGQVAGKQVELKSYDTGHLQILRVNGIDNAGPMDMAVTAWKEHILQAVS